MNQRLRFIPFSVICCLLLSLTTPNAVIAEEGVSTPYGYIKNDYREEKLSKFRNDETYSLFSLIGNQTKLDRHYAVISLADRIDEPDRIDRVLGIALLDYDMRVRSAAFDTFIKRGDKRLAEAICLALFSRDDGSRFEKAFDLADQRVLDIFKEIYLKNYDTPYALKGLDLILSSSDLQRVFKLDEIAAAKLTNEILDNSSRHFSYGAPEKRAAVMDFVLVRGKRALKRIVMRYEKDTPGTAEFLTASHRYDRRNTEDAIFENLKYFSFKNNIRNQIYPVKFLKSIASADLANRIVDSIVAGTSQQSVEFKTKCLAAWPMEKSKNQLKKYIKPGKTAAPYAVNAAGIIGDKSFTPLILEYIKTARANDRRTGIKALGYLKDSRAVQPLCDLLKGENDFVMGSSIITSLGYIGDVSAIPSILAFNKKKKAAKSTVEAFSMMPSDKSVPFLYQELKEFKSSWGGYKKPDIFDALILQGDNTAVLMRQVLKDTNSSSKTIAEALSLLRHTGNKNDVELVISFLNNKSRNVRNMAAYTLGDLGTALDIPSIIESSTKPLDVKDTMILIGKPGIPELTKIVNNKQHIGREVAGKALSELYDVYSDYRAGNINLKLGKYKTAAKHFSNAFNHKKNFYKAKLNQGVAEYYQREYKKAMKTFNDVRVRSPELRAAALTNLAATYRQAWGTTGYSDEYPGLAGIYAAQSLNHKQDLPVANYNMAWIYEERLELESAEMNLSNAIANKPQYLKALILKASVLAQNGEKDKAKIVLGSLSKSPDLQEDLKIAVNENLATLSGESI